MPAEKLVAQDLKVSNAGDTALLNTLKAEFVGGNSEAYYTVSTRFYTAQYGAIRFAMDSLRKDCALPS